MNVHAKGFKRAANPERFTAFRATNMTSAIISKYPELSYEYLHDAPDDQGQVGSCTAHGSGGQAEDFFFKRKGHRINVSFRAIYSQTKHAFEPNDIRDDGADVGDALKVIKQFGYVLESDWPYYTDGRLLEPVPENLWKTDFEFKDFVSVPIDATAFRLALLQHGPLVVGLPWFPEWEDVDPDGILPTAISSPNGGHCVRLVGYSDSRQAFRLANSWGASWADKGYAWMDYSLAHVIQDAYTVSV